MFRYLRPLLWHLCLATKMQLEGFVPLQQRFDIVDHLPLRQHESGQRQ